MKVIIDQDKCMAFRSMRSRRAEVFDQRNE